MSVFINKKYCFSAHPLIIYTRQLLITVDVANLEAQQQVLPIVLRTEIDYQAQAHLG